MESNLTDPIERKIAAREDRVLAEVKKVPELTEIQYVPGFEDSVGLFPILEGEVLARFSYGPKATNMSNKYGQSEKEAGTRNRSEFFESQGFGSNRIDVGAKFDGAHPQFEEVNLDTLVEEGLNILNANMVVTRDPRVALYILPADCPVMVISAKDKEGNPLIGIIHAGRDSLNSGIPRDGLTYLETEYGVDLSKTKGAIFPGASEKNYFITNGMKYFMNGIRNNNWGPFQKPDEGGEDVKRFVDMLSAFEMQAIEAGLKAENIEAYRRDLYEDAGNGMAFSHRYSSEHNGEREGRNLIAAQINARSKLYPKP